MTQLGEGHHHSDHQKVAIRCSHLHYTMVLQSYRRLNILIEQYEQAASDFTPWPMHNEHGSKVRKDSVSHFCTET